MRGLSATIIAVLLAALASPSAAEAPRPIARTASGAVAGVRDGAVEVFKGLPYASQRRWEPPSPPRPWSGVRDASQFGPICPQPVGPRRNLDQKQSEDCLYLNVWTFAGARKAPVMVWIHGGAFRFGSGSQRFYDGADFAKDGVVLVSINYRLGALGAFAHPALVNAVAPNAPIGDYGLMDQIAALKWVQRNIAAFGGDPANVTVFGESAGGLSVLTLMATPSARGLFAKAVVESGGGWEAERTLAQAEKAGVALAEAAGLGPDATLGQLRAIPVEKLLQAPLTLGGAGPFVDGRLLKEDVTQAFAAGREAPVPLMIGSNSYEASLMAPFKVAPSAMLRLAASDRSLYPADDAKAAADVFTDAIMGAPAQWLAARQSRLARVYLYHFSYVPTAQRSTRPGAAHGSEIPFVFGAWPAIFNRFASPQDHAVERLMHACWVAFAKTGAPSCGDLAWPAYAPASGETMEFGLRSGALAHFRQAQYDALDASFLPRLLAAP
ncbi:MAG: carboxylesterase/lipase family protein [Caulobacteraceae bacterium]